MSPAYLFRSEAPWEINTPAFFCLPHQPEVMLCNLWGDIGYHFYAKFLQQCDDSGAERAALNLRKQGVPIEIVLRMLRAR